MASPSKSRLGRGLGGLISGGKPAVAKPATAAKEPTASARTNTVPAGAPTEAKPAPGNEKLLEVLLQDIDPNPYQPRKEFDQEKLEELASSIRAEGLLTPILVRKVGNRYQIISGERRLRACKLIGLKRIPVLISDSSDSSSAVIALIENLQRDDLNPVEEARGYARLMKEFQMTQDTVAGRVGKARASVANSLRLLQLDGEILGYLERNLLSVGHAKVLLGVADPARRLLLARRTIEEGWSVREAEKRIKTVKETTESTGEKRQVDLRENQAIEDLQRKLTSHLGTRVAFRHSPKKGKIVIEYFGNEDLQRILDVIGMRS
jgi:ParB family chromosome partitioning protein